MYLLATCQHLERRLRKPPLSISGTAGTEAVGRGARGEDSGKVSQYFNYTAEASTQIYYSCTSQFSGSVTSEMMSGSKRKSQNGKQAD